MSMTKQRQPDHCKGCSCWHKAGHPKGSPLHGSKYDNWCCQFGNHAPRVVSICLQQNAKKPTE